MTCIVAIRDDKNKTVWMGGDSCVSSNWNKCQIKDRKVFKTVDNTAIIGCCGSMALINILSSVEGIIDKVDYYEDKVDVKSLTLKTIPKLLKLFKSYDIIHPSTLDNNCKTVDGCFLLAVKDKLFVIQDDLSIFEAADQYLSVGSGSEYAIGAISKNENIEPALRIEKALRSATKHGVGVDLPYYIINTSDDKVITINE